MWSQLLSAFVCMCPCVPAHVCVGAQASWTCSCRTQRTTQTTFSSCRLIWFHLWDSVSQWTRRSSIWQDQLILKPQGFACLHYRLSAGITVTSWHTWRFMWMEGIPNSQTHVCPASTLQPVLPPQPAHFHTLQVRWPVWSNVFLFVPYSFRQNHISAHLQNVIAVLISSDKDPGLKDHNPQSAVLIWFPFNQCFCWPFQCALNSKPGVRVRLWVHWVGIWGSGGVL